MQYKEMSSMEHTVMTEKVRGLSSSFRALNVAQFLGAFNDNMFKLLMVFFLISANGASAAGAVSAKAGLVFVIPFLLFSAFSGVLADRISKRRIIVTAKVLEVAVMLLGTAAFFAGSETGLYITLFAMASQSALFSPSKYGIIPEIVRKDQMARANSYLESFAYVAIIAGTALAPLLSRALSSRYDVASVLCVICAAAGLAASVNIESTPPGGSQKKAKLFFIRDIAATLKEVRKDRHLFLAVLGAAYFMFIGAYAQINLIPFGMETLNMTQEQSSYLFFCAAVGIGIGACAAGRFSENTIEAGIIPIGAAGLVLSTSFLALKDMGIAAALASVVLFGISAGLFIVPVNSFIQMRSPSKERGAILAASGFLGWIGVLFAAGLSFFMSRYADLTAAQGFMAVGCITAVMTAAALKVLPDFLLRFLVLVFMRLPYRISVIGIEHIPSEGPALLAPNHVSWIDALLLTATQQRRIRFLMQRELYSIWYIRPVLKLMGVIPVSSEGRPREVAASLQQARAAVENGEVVCIFPEGAITRNGLMNRFKPGLERVVRGLDCPVIPVYLGNVWGSVFSYYHGRLFSRLPQPARYPVTILFGRPLPSSCRAHEVQQAVCELSCEYFNSRKGERYALAQVLVASVRRHWREAALSDTGGAELTQGNMLTVSMALARVMRKRTGSGQALGIALPPSAGGALVNIAAALLGRVSVNINYTGSAESMRSAAAQCGLRALITSRAFQQKVPLPVCFEKTLYLEDLLEEISGLDRACSWIRARFFPLSFVVRNSGNADDTAAVIFSSGSTGEPKGVMLSHHNIISNVEAVQMVLRTSPKDNICSALPFFHSLGYTGTIWLPLLSGFSVTYHANPMEGGKIAMAVRTRRSTFLLAAPTFLLSYIRRAAPDDFRSLRLVITGAEKLKDRVAQAFREKFGILPLEGYGATELSPVITLSVPDAEAGGLRHNGWRNGSTGKALPGVVLRIVDPVTRKTVLPGEEGMIMVKGPSLMTGYLNRPDLTAHTIRDGWFETGDVGRLDTDGFLFITDRLSRFSKVGGEMIPHRAIEDELYRLTDAPDQTLAVTAVPDERRGEALILLYTARAGSRHHLQSAMARSALPNLWRPAETAYFELNELPMLGSGKIDFRRLGQIALEKFSAQAA